MRSTTNLSNFDYLFEQEGEGPDIEDHIAYLSDSALIDEALQFDDPEQGNGRLWLAEIARREIMSAYLHERYRGKPPHASTVLRLLQF